MDIILASSRGREMNSELRKIHPCPDNLLIKFIPSAGLSSLAGLVPSFTGRGEAGSIDHVYFLAGLCDVTNMSFDDRWSYEFGHYEEVIFNESPHEAVSRVQEIYRSVSESVTKANAIPCFSTIPPMSLETWNTIRLNQQKTSFLIHHRQYESMQENLINTIIDINRFIIHLNIANQMTTPYLASTILSNVPGRKMRVHYSRFSDGVHPTQELNKKWAKKLNNAIRDNRGRAQQVVRPFDSLSPSYDSDIDLLGEEIRADIMSHLQSLPRPVVNWD